jgi:hypothetical protein
MSQLVVDRSSALGSQAPLSAGEFGDWTGYRIPEDRSRWYPLVRLLYDYWQSIAPPAVLPGRQHVVPEHIAPLWSRLFMLDVFRDPLRFRYRLCGTALVRSLGREVTGAWLDEAQPQLVANPQSRDRLRLMAETGVPTWRRGPPLCARDPAHCIVEGCIVPLAADGRTVDKLLGVLVAYDSAGNPL